MKKLLIIIPLFLIALNLSSQDKGTGLGIIVGEPTGISLKSWISSNSAFDAGLAWSFIDDGSIHVHADYLIHFNTFNNSRIPLYVGIGGRVKFKNNKKIADNKFGVRVPIGVALFINNAPIDVFLELVPVLDLSPKTTLTFNGALGVRYFF